MACTKQLNFASADGAHLTYYWTMAEAGALPKVDSAQGHAWVPVAGTSTQAGLFNNAVQFDCLGGIITPHTHGLYNNDDAGLAIASTSKGISFWFWFKLATAGAQHNAELSFEFYTMGFGIDYQIRVIYSMIPGVGTSGFSFEHFDYNGPGTATSSGTFDLTLGTWHMFAGTIDFTANQIKSYIDGTLRDTQPDTVGISGSTTLGWLFAENLFGAGGIGDPFVSLFDEMGLCLNGVLTADQVTSLWNGGTGVTWPGISAIVPYP